ncbi:galactokinase, partial [Nitriliruptoria bacterium AS10]|nr:galactokinase [Salsipaludibacter albus]
ILDQVTVAHARAGHAMLLDCATTTWEHVPVPDDVEVVVLDTGARRQLVASAYDERRRECDRAASALGVATLRELGSGDLGRLDRLPPRLAARVRHVVTENARVRVVAAALAAGDVASLGAALAASHASLRDDYEVTGPELDTMADLANATEGVLGARMTGGGFAGAVVAVAPADVVAWDELVARYRRVHDLPGRARLVRSVDGTGPSGDMPVDGSAPTPGRRG